MTSRNEMNYKQEGKEGVGYNFNDTALVMERKEINS
jgi:hypothetical protein